ncbi:unnamed protein product [Psylliodes chrysocephalus]|uniref:Nose resistant-to-fluoxetine protein N-terminal domain-containing protein n=1 Tax=Psylliodes chrysocephalus TaxID=3402493 RepID=A0A9P0CNH2_9CUCU|nr:unnamed protein product [Psylliodes chrysocephala]
MFKILACIILISFNVFNTEATPKKFKFVIPPFIIKSLKNKVEHVLEMAGGNSQCAKDIKTLFNDALHMKRWALEMLDATGKLQSGIFAGNFFMNGNFDECIDIKEMRNKTIRGQYCTVLLTPSDRYSHSFDFSNAATLKEVFGVKTSSQISDVLKNIKMSYGICIPDSCSIGNLQTLWDYVEYTFRIPVHLNFFDTMCSTKIKGIKPFDFDVLVHACFGLYFILLALITGYDILFHQKVKGTDSLWISFSIYTNAKKIFTVNDELTENNFLAGISGIKAICMLWILYAHRVLLNLLTGATNLIYVLEWKSKVFTAFNLSSSFAVDTFLMLSGLLLSFSILTYKSTRPKMTIPVLPLYIYRFLRLSPALIAMILFNISIFKHLNNGPIWPLRATTLAVTCSKTWLATLLFLSNMIDVNYQCMEQAWYLAVDCQLFFISPIILVNLLSKPVRTVLACIGICLLTGIYTFIITIRNNYGSIYFESNKEYYTNIYTSTIVRMPPWFIGIIFGYILFKYKHIKLTKVVSSLAWITAFLTLAGLILVHLVFTATNEYNVMNAAIFNSSARQFWALAIGLILFLCTINRDGKINAFLSMPLFRIIVRISYSVYLTQGAVLIYFTSGKKNSTYFSDITNIHDFLGDLFFIFIMGLLWCLAFESPFIAVAKYLYKREELSRNKVAQKRKKNKKTKNNYIVCVYKYEEDEDTMKKIK